MEKNLDIHNYSLDELFKLFELNIHDKITVDQLKTAKKKVLMMHPDKSNLPSTFFLFYKKAFEIVVKEYDAQQKTESIVPDTKIDYVPEVVSDLSQQNKEHVKSQIQKISSSKMFQKQFNEIFEETLEKKSVDNHWFKNTNSLYNLENVQSAKDMGKRMQELKQKQHGLIQYTGVVSLSSGNGSNYHESDDSQYISCDPFSKLKFDDLRKVHKDQTIFTVDESEFSKVKQYTSVDQYVRSREIDKPMDKQASEVLLQQQEKEYKDRMLKKQHESELKTMEYEEKNKKIISSFLQIR
jgi:hypothetical protein